MSARAASLRTHIGASIGDVWARSGVTDFESMFYQAYIFPSDLNVRAASDRRSPSFFRPLIIALLGATGLEGIRESRCVGQIEGHV